MRLVGFRIILILSGVLFITACATPKQAVEPDPVTVKVVNLPFISFAPFYIGIEEGYFEEQGIELEFVDLRLPQEIIPALISGQVDASAGLVSAGLFNTVAGGGEMRIVADKGYVDPDGCSNTAIVAIPSLAESVDWSNPDEIRGRQLDASKSTWNEYFSDKVLNTVGLTINDMNVIDLPSSSELAAMQEGSLELNSVNEPWQTHMIEGGNVPVMASQTDVLPDSTSAVVFYGPALLGENSDAGNRFMTAYLKAVRQYNEGKTDRNVEILSEHLSLEPELLRKMCWQAIKNNGDINTADLMAFQDWAANAGYIENKIELNQIWEPKFIEYAVGVLGKAEE